MSKYNSEGNGAAKHKWELCRDHRSKFSRVNLGIEVYANRVRYVDVIAGNEQVEFFHTNYCLEFNQFRSKVAYTSFKTR